MIDCTFYFLSLPAHVSAVDCLSKIGHDAVLISGVPHGWVLEPHASETKDLLRHEWNVFILALSSNQAIDSVACDHATAFIKGSFSIEQTQYDQLAASNRTPATPAKDTPSLPQEWSDGQTGKVPTRHVFPAKEGPLKPGELKLYEPMAAYLSTTLPDAVRDKPVSLFNLFEYRDGDPSVHEHYMQGFKERFGPAAGAQLRFMGPVSTQPALIDQTMKTSAGEASAMRWQDANLVQYDSIWHYAYMISTDVYQELNQEKMRGLDDTCILLISELELEK